MSYTLTLCMKKLLHYGETIVLLGDHPLLDNLLSIHLGKHRAECKGTDWWEYTINGGNPPNEINLSFFVEGKTVDGSVCFIPEYGDISYTRRCILKNEWNERKSLCLQFEWVFFPLSSFLQPALLSPLPFSLPSSLSPLLFWIMF